MRIGLIVDHPKRDVAGIALVAYEIAKRGGEALIVPMYEQGVDIPRLDLDAILVNFARAANRPLIELYAASGTSVFVLDTEGGVLADKGANTPATLARTLRDSGYAALLSGYLFWGTELYDAFLREGAMPADRLHVTGCPRFDFAARRWRALLAGEDTGYLLFNANFPLVNPRFSGSPGREREAMISAGWDGDYVDRLMADLSGILPRYLATIRELALTRPQRSILVRPHPFENEQPYRAALGDLPNVVVNGEGNVLNVIHNAAAVVHLNCGTAIEAVMLEKLPVHLRFLDTPATAGHASLPARISRAVGSAAELVAVVDDLERESSRFSLTQAESYIRPYFHDIDGNAAARVADVLMRHSARRSRRSRFWQSLGTVIVGSRSGASTAQIAQGVASAIIGSAVTSKLRSRLDPRRREKAISPTAVDELIGRIARHDRQSAKPPRIVRAHGFPFGVPLASLRVIAAG